MSDIEHIKLKFNVDRFDILCGGPFKMPTYPCEKCESDKCDGVGECEGYGSYVLAVSVKGI